MAPSGTFLIISNLLRKSVVFDVNIMIFSKFLNISSLKWILILFSLCLHEKWNNCFLVNFFQGRHSYGYIYFLTKIWRMYQKDFFLSYFSETKVLFNILITTNSVLLEISASRKNQPDVFQTPERFVLNTRKRIIFLVLFPLNSLLHIYILRTFYIPGFPHLNISHIFALYSLFLFMLLLSTFMFN